LSSTALWEAVVRPIPTFMVPICTEKISPIEISTRHSPGRTSKMPGWRVHLA